MTSYYCLVLPLPRDQCINKYQLSTILSHVVPRRLQYINGGTIGNMTAWNGPHTLLQLLACLLIFPLFISSMEHHCCFRNQLLPSLLVHSKSSIPSRSSHFASPAKLSLQPAILLCLHFIVQFPVWGMRAWPKRKDECLNDTATDLNLKNWSGDVNSASHPKYSSPSLLTCNIRVTILTSGSYCKTLRG